MGKRPKRSQHEKHELAAIGARLKHIANFKFGGSVTELVAATGISQPTWSRVLTGEQAPSWKLLLALIVMGVNVEWVLTGRGYPFLEDSVQHREASRRSASPRRSCPVRPSSTRTSSLGWTCTWIN